MSAALETGDLVLRLMWSVVMITGVVCVERGSDMFGVGLCLSHPGHDRNKKVSEEVDHKDRYQLKHDSPVY